MIELIDVLIERLGKLRAQYVEDQDLDARIATKRKIEANIDAQIKQATALRDELSDANVKLQSINNDLKAENSRVDAKIADGNKGLAKLRQRLEGAA